MKRRLGIDAINSFFFFFSTLRFSFCCVFAQIMLKKIAFGLVYIMLNYSKFFFAPEVHVPQLIRPEQVPVLHKSISRRSNIVVVQVQVKIDH